MKVALFCMDGSEGEENILDMINLILKAGHSCVRVNYWTNDFLPKESFISNDHTFLTITEGGLKNAPRLTQEEYKKANGSVEDFYDLTLHDAGSEGYRLTFERLFLESRLYQRLRGISIKVRSIIKSIEPDIVLVPHGAEGISRIISIESSYLKIPAVIWESPFFPGFINLDIGSQHFFRKLSRIDRLLPKYLEKNLEQDEREKTERFIKNWKENKISKYKQENNFEEYSLLKSFTKNNKSSVVFLATQLPWDANVIQSLGKYKSLKDLYCDFIEKVDKKTKIVVKIHPKDHTNTLIDIFRKENILVLKDIDIHNAISVSDVVFVHSSNVGLEALISWKPVIVTGQPFYSGYELTKDIKDFSNINKIINDIKNEKLNIDLIYKMISFIINHHLIPVNNENRLNLFFEEAINTPSSILKSLNKLENFYQSDISKKYIDIQREYDAFAKKNYFHDEIMNELCIEDINKKSDINSGKRQVVFNYSDVEIGHLTRYCFVKTITENKKSTVLDIACGSGYGSHLLAEVGCSVVAIDGCIQAIEFAKKYWKHDNVKFFNLSGEKAFAEERIYDVVVSFETVEHVYDYTILLNQLWNSVKLGGILIISTPNAQFYPLLNHEFHVKHFTDKDIIDEIEKLPDVFSFNILYQDKNVISRKIQNSRFIITTIVKKSNENQVIYEIPDIFIMNSIPFRSSFCIGSESFSTNTGTKVNNLITSNFAQTNCHFIYGPYIKLPIGKYKIDFLLLIEFFEKNKFEKNIVLEIVNTNGDFLGKKNIEFNHLNKDYKHDYSVDFFNETDDLSLEFRVYLCGNKINGNIAFSGVHISTWFCSSVTLQ